MVAGAAQGVAVPVRGEGAGASFAGKGQVLLVAARWRWACVRRSLRFRACVGALEELHRPAQRRPPALRGRGPEVVPAPRLESAPACLTSSRVMARVRVRDRTWREAFASRGLRPFPIVTARCPAVWGLMEAGARAGVARKRTLGQAAGRGGECGRAVSSRGLPGGAPGGGSVSVG